MRHPIIMISVVIALAACEDDAQQGGNDTSASDDATTAADTSVAADSQEPDSAEPDSDEPDSVAPDSVAPDTTVAPDTLITEPDTTPTDATVAPDTTVELDTTIEPDVATHDDCDPKPCVHGTCTDIGDGYACDCDDGWAGTDCDACDEGFELQADGGCARPFACPELASTTTLVNGNGCYFFFDDAASTFGDARTRCQENDAELIAIQGLFEQYPLEVIFDRNDTWIGLEGNDVDGLDDAWDSGEPLDYLPYDTWLPDFVDTGYVNYCVIASEDYWYAEGCDASAYAGCEIKTCGDGHRDSNEACDDGNAIDGDGCDRNCTLSACGNLVVAPDEDCEPALNDFCPSDCHFTCGQGSGAYAALDDITGCYLYFQAEVTRDAASAMCAGAGATLVTARSAYVEDTIDEWLGGYGYKHWIGLSDAAEEGLFGWDDGSDYEYTNWYANEPSATDSDDDCVVTYSELGWSDTNCTEDVAAVVCSITTCGDGVPNGTEECDDGNAVDGDGCDTNCRESGCGNGIQAPNEDCELSDSHCPDDCTFECGHGSGADRALLDSTGCYLYFATSMNYANASARCAAIEGATLTAVPSVGVDNAVTKLTEGRSVMIGYRDSETEGTWVWSDGTVSDYERFGVGEPNNQGDEDCAQVSVGGWNDITCTSLQPFVCSIRTCGDDNVDPGETCDDHNFVDGDGCDSSCKPSGCGSGVVTGDEVCEPDADARYTTCTESCQIPCAAESGATAAILTDDRCYAYFASEVGSTAATEKCESLGGYLAVVTSQSEHDMLASMSYQSMRIGGTDVAEVNVWTWVNGEPWSFEAWEGSEPNGGTSENCLEITGNDGWNDLSCSQPQPFVCELPLTP